MSSSKADIIALLEKDILPLQGFKSVPSNNQLHFGLGPINNAFPGKTFPTAAIHEFICNSPENATATAGFIGGLLASLMKYKGAVIWISSGVTLFPPALQMWRIDPAKILFINLKKEEDILWAMEEALKCESNAAVVSELKDISFMASRRLQLAVEKSNVTGFILRHSVNKPNITACISRWKITSLPANSIDDLPGVGFPRWKVELLKIRNGRPGQWEVEFVNGRFKNLSKMRVVHHEELQKKTG